MAFKPTRQIIFGGINDAPTAATTEYASLFGGNSSNTWATTEAWRRNKFPIAGQISDLRVVINTAPGGAASVTFTVMKNGSATGAMAVTISGANVSAVYSGAPISIAAGDDISMRCTQASTPSLFTVASWSLIFTPTAVKRCIFTGGTGNGTGDVASGTIEYQPISGGYTWNTGDELRSTDVIIDGTIRSWRITLSTTVASGTTLEFAIYKNGVKEASSALTFVGGGGQSAQSISGLSIDIAPGDYLSIGCLTTNGGTPLASAIYGRWGVEVEPDNDGESQISGLNVSPSTTAAEYAFPTNHSAIDGSATEALRTAVAGNVKRFTLTALRHVLGVAPGSGKNRTVKVRKNGADGNLVAVVADTATATNDTSHEDVFEAGDTMSILTTPSGTPAASSLFAWAAKMRMLWTYEVQTKSLKYCVIREHAVTKSLTYEIAGEVYSREANVSLPTTDADLANIYTVLEYALVAEEDGFYASQGGDSGDYLLHQFKYEAPSNTRNISVRWSGKAGIAPSAATVYLQVYNHDTDTWDTIDSDGATAAGTDFKLAGTITTSPEDYYDASNVVTARVYQQRP